MCACRLSPSQYAPAACGIGGCGTAAATGAACWSLRTGNRSKMTARISATSTTRTLPPVRRGDINRTRELHLFHKASARSAESPKLGGEVSESKASDRLRSSSSRETSETGTRKATPLTNNVRLVRVGRGN